MTTRPSQPAWLLLLVVAALARAQLTEPSETCSAVDDKQKLVVDVEPDADVRIGALLDVHGEGGGVFGCSQRVSDVGLHYYEALRWAVKTLNQDSGYDTSSGRRPVSQSFIPGVKLGLQVYDSCGHMDLTIKYMTDLFPVLKAGNECETPDENNTRVIGMVDGTGASNIQRVSDAINKSWIPAIPLNEATAVPPEQVAKVLAEVVHDMEWERVAVIHAEDEYSLYITKIFSQIAFAGFPCITSMKPFPDMRHMKSKERSSVHKLVNSITGRLPDDSAVLIIAQGDSLKDILRVLKNSPDLARLQWLFSWSLPTEDLAEVLQETRVKRIYSLSPYPSQISTFEKYWSKLQSGASVLDIEDRWFLEYAMGKKHCQIPGFGGGSTYSSNLVMCDDYRIKESSIDTLSKTSRFIPSFHAVFTFANAYKSAWTEKCKGLPGVCADLRKMTKKEFVEQYLEPLTFEHSPELRSPEEMKGQKTNRSARGEMDNGQLALNVYYYSEGRGLQVNQVFAYDSQEAKVLDENFKHQASLCPRGGCKNCVSIRQSRLESQSYESQPSEDFLTIAQSEDVLIPILLPIHQAGSNPMECGAALNPEVVQNLEAALWTIDQVNEDPEYLPGVRLGAVIIDTCSSPVTLTQRLSNFLMGVQHERPDEFFSPLAVISAGGPEEFAAAAAVLSPLNVTLVSSTDSVRPKHKMNKHLQTAVPIETRVEAVARMLAYFGWNYVPVIYDATERSRHLLSLFRQYAKDTDVCLSMELPVTSLDNVETDYLISQMVQAKDHGAKVIVMWTNEMATNVFIEALRRAVMAGVLGDSDFVVICNGEWISDVKSFKSFENQTVGMLTLEPEQGEVPDFEAYYKRLQPARNKRNPWFGELWNEINPCDADECMMTPSSDRPTSLYSPHSSTVHVIQAVLSLSAGLARLRNDLCKSQPGFCPKFFQQPHIRELFHKYVLETASTRLDVRGEMFTYTKEGYGSIPINIYSFRRRSQNTLSYQKVGNYLQYKTELTGTIVYSATGVQIAIEDVSSTCRKHCESCRKRSADFLVLESDDNIYISAAMGIHESTDNPLTCGAVSLSPGVQNLEAYLWAIDQINSSPQLLPGVSLGTIVFDTCNSKERAARDISNFFSGSVVSSSKIPKLSQVVGMLTTAADDTIEPIIDVTVPFKMLTVATDASSTKFNDVSKYPSLLRSTLPNDMIAEGLIDLLKHFRWNYVSVLYSDNSWKQADLFEAFKSKADVRNVEFALVEKLPMSSYETSMKNILNRLVMKKGKGARVVVLLLNSAHMKMFFSTVTKQQDSGSVSPGDFVWIGIDNLEVFHTYPDVSLGAVMLRSSTSTIVPFKQYFENLHLKNNTRNPWFREYWEKTHDCQGASCHKKENMVRMPLLQHASVPTVINSVLSVAVGLENIRSRLCPGLQRGLCQAMRDEAIVREMLQNVTRSTSFTGVDGKLFKFTRNNFAAGVLEVFNFIQVGSNARAFIEVGQFSPDEGLFLNYSKVKTYDESGREISLYHVKSQCMDDESCQTKDEKQDVSVMEMASEQDFVIGVAMPVHQKGETFFECGEIRDDRVFQNLVAVSYAIDRINQNTTALSSVNLGAIVFDYCSRRQKAEEQLYRYFSKDSEHVRKMKIKPKSVFAAITYGSDVAKDLAPVLDGSSLSQIAMPAGEIEFDERDEVLYAVPSSGAQVQAVISILNRFDWRYVNLVYSNTDFGRSGYYHFSKAAARSGVCLASIVMLDVGSTPEFISSTFRSELHPSDAKVIVMLIDDARLMNSTLSAAKQESLLQSYTWVSTYGFDNRDDDIALQLQNAPADVIAIKLENERLPDFVEYFSNMSPHNHEPIPDPWFDSWWQHKFQCRLSDSDNAKTQYSHVCSGNERLRPEDIVQDTHIYHTVRLIEDLGNVLQKYFDKQCSHGMTLSDCGPNARADLTAQIKRKLFGDDPDCEECRSSGTMFGYDVFKMASVDDRNASNMKIGSWKNGLLTIYEQNVKWVSGSVPSSTCLRDCDACTNQLGEVQNLSSIKHDLYTNFKEVWGITVSSLSVLGMILVIICALYFLMSFPVTVGTTVLGYMILFGLFVLYAVNFAFIISPTEGSCGVRRFGLGLAYAIIFSGMLVKVMNTWRIMGYNGSRMLNDGTRMSSPAGLLVIAVGLVIIQILLSSAWLILMPPKIGAYELVWRCAPPTTFEEGLVVSLVYVMLLLAITTLFAILTWQCQDNNRESRWILGCSTMVAVIWLAWTILSTQISPHNRDLTIAAANLINATIIMVCLYLRKVYLYSKLMRQAKDQELKAHLQPSPHTHSVYGTSQKSGPFSTLAPVLYGSQASLTAKKLYNNPSSRLELINCPEDNKSDSSGSVQVQATDLYPLDMYDGGSQFQPISSLFGSNHTLVLDDTLTFGR